MERGGVSLCLLVFCLTFPAAAEASAPKHLIHKIVVDAGHGGNDSGAVSPYGPKEKDVVLDLARRVQLALEKRGFEVEMTRDSDVFIPLTERAQLANRFGADLFVSIHANASPSPALRGFEVYTLSEETDDVALAASRSNGSELDATLWDLRETENRRESLRIARQVTGAVKETSGAGLQRVRDANFYVLKWTEMPAVLIETGYLTNRADERSLRSAIHKQRLSDAIVRGLWAFKTEYESTDGFTR